MLSQVKYGLSLAALAAVMTVGCNKSPEGGTPHTSSSFTLSLPATSTTIKQGDKQTVKISVNRGKDFKESVKLKVDTPEKITATLSDDSVAPSEGADVTVTIDVAKDAAIGEHKVKVSGTPGSGTGTAVSQDFTIKVEKNP